VCGGVSCIKASSNLERLSGGGVHTAEFGFRTAFAELALKPHVGEMLPPEL
jgi:hypothetical protein